jgi:hypothetical protein
MAEMVSATPKTVLATSKMILEDGFEAKIGRKTCVFLCPMREFHA